MSSYTKGTKALIKKLNAWKQQPDGIQKALEHVHASTEQNILPLHAMAVVDWPELIAQFSDEAWLDVMEEKYEGDFLLHLGARGSVETLQELLRKGATDGLFEYNDEGYTALLVAVNTGNTLALQSLIVAGADVDQGDEEGLDVPLGHAVFNNDRETVEMLINAGANPMLVDLNDESLCDEHEDVVSVVKNARALRQNMTRQRYKVLEIRGEDTGVFVPPSVMLHSGSVYANDVMGDMIGNYHAFMKNKTQEEESLRDKVLKKRTPTTEGRTPKNNGKQ